MSPGTRRHVPFQQAAAPLFGSNPHLHRLFNSREEAPRMKLAGLGGAGSATLWLRAPLTEVCVLPSAIPLLWTQVRLGKDGPCRATGDNQTHSHSIKRLLDCAKAVFEWDTEGKHRKGLVLMTHSTCRRPNVSKCNRRTPMRLSAHGEGRHLMAPALPSLSPANSTLAR